jgi:hypothetical protein
LTSEGRIDCSVCENKKINEPVPAISRVCVSNSNAKTKLVNKNKPQTKRSIYSKEMKKKSRRCFYVSNDVGQIREHECALLSHGLNQIKTSQFAQRKSFSSARIIQRHQTNKNNTFDCNCCLQRSRSFSQSPHSTSPKLEHSTNQIHKNNKPKTNNEQNRKKQKKKKQCRIPDLPPTAARRSSTSLFATKSESFNCHNENNKQQIATLKQLCVVKIYDLLPSSTVRL